MSVPPPSERAIARRQLRSYPHPAAVIALDDPREKVGVRQLCGHTRSPLTYYLVPGRFWPWTEGAGCVGAGIFGVLIRVSYIVTGMPPLPIACGLSKGAFMPLLGCATDTLFAFSIVEMIIFTVLPSLIGLLTSLLSLVIGLGGIALWVFLMYKAYNHERFKLPLVGDLAEKQA